MIDFAALFRQVARKQKQASEPTPELLEYTLPRVSYDGATLEDAEVRFSRLTEFAVWVNGERIPLTPANYTDYGISEEPALAARRAHRLLCYGVTFWVPEDVLAPFVLQLEHLAQAVEDYYARRIGIEL